jgi:hypothetical protein
MSTVGALRQVWKMPAIIAASSSVTSFADLLKYARQAASTP